MKLLLTSNGLSNKSIAKAFIELIGKEPKDAKVAFIPTAGMVALGDKQWLVNALYNIKKLGFYLDIVDLAQLTKEEWMERVKDCDALFVGGGNTFYLSYWMDKSGFFDELPKMLETKVYAGISAGSSIVTASLKTTSQMLRRHGQVTAKEYSIGLGPKGRSASKSAKLLPFLIRPHYNERIFFETDKAFIQKVADTLDEPMYVIDDDTAIKVVDGKIDIISEGKWEKYD